MFLFNKNLNLIKWENNNNIQEYIRQKMQQYVINKVIGLTYTDLYFNESDITILDIGGGYSEWSSDFWKIHLNKLNKIYIYNLDINDYLGYHLRGNIELESKIIYNNLEIKNEIKKNKTEIIKNGFFTIYKKINLIKENIPYDDNSIYFVYHRDMITVYNEKQWCYIINEINRILKKDCYSEFVEYDFIIKNSKYNDLTFDINNFLERKFGEVNIKNIYYKIMKVFTNVKIKKIKLQLYGDSLFNKKCIDIIILGYLNIKNDILKISKNKYNNKNITFEEIINELIIEWKENKCYIELHFISAKK